MKKLGLILSALIFCASAARAAIPEWRTAVMYLTNSATTNDAYIVNGAVRIGGGARIATEWVTNASPMQVTTNIMSQIGGWPWSGVIVSNIATNIIIFRGFDLTLDVTNFALPAFPMGYVAWGSTNLASTNETAHMHPIAAHSSTYREYVTSDDVAALSLYPTNYITESTNGVLRRYATLTHTQTFANKTLIAPVNLGGTSSNQFVTNANLHALSAELYGARLAEGAYASNLLGSIKNPKIITGGGDIPGDDVAGYTNTFGGVTAVQYDQSALNGFHLHSFRFGPSVWPWWSISISTNGFFLTQTPNWGGSQNLLSLYDGRVTLGDSASVVTMGGPVVAMIATNSTFKGRNTNSGDWASPAYVITSLADGINPGVIFGTNYNITLAGTVTAPVTIIGIEGGRNGKEYKVYNALGHSVIWAESTSDPTAANRFDHIDNSDIVSPPGSWTTLIYSSSLSRWTVANVYPSSSALVFGQVIAEGLTTDTNHVTTAATWYRWTNQNATAITNLMASSNNTNLVTTLAGYYEVRTDIAAKFLIDTTTVTNALFTNGVVCPLTKSVFDADFPGGTTDFVHGIGASAFIYLPAGATIDMRFSVLAGAATEKLTTSRRSFSARALKY